MFSDQEEQLELGQSELKTLLFITEENQMNGTFDLGFVTDQPNLSLSIPYFSVDHLMKKHHITHLHVLHSDIQGYESKMLEGCKEAFNKRTIDYFFISTHSQELHNQCITKLQSAGYTILCDADLDESYSVDGVIVAKRMEVPGPDKIDISKRSVLFNDLSPQVTK